MQNFLKQCAYVSDKVQFNKLDYWMPPEDFEAAKKGDCEDFALWTWRQLLSMGYEARFVVGKAGKYGSGHAWVSFINEEKGYIFEPLAAWFSDRLPKLTTVRYEPFFSVSWDGNTVHYYEHQNNSFNPSITDMVTLITEWVVFWSKHKPIVLTKRMKYRYLRIKYIFSQLFKKDKNSNSLNT